MNAITLQYSTVVCPNCKDKKEGCEFCHNTGHVHFYEGYGYNKMMAAYYEFKAQETNEEDYSRC